MVPFCCFSHCSFFLFAYILWFLSSAFFSLFQEAFYKILEASPERESRVQLEAYLLQNSAALVTVLPVIDDFLRTVDFHSHALGVLYLLYVLNGNYYSIYYFIIFCLIGVVFLFPLLSDMLSWKRTKLDFRCQPSTLTTP